MCELKLGKRYTGEWEGFLQVLQWSERTVQSDQDQPIESNCPECDDLGGMYQGPKYFHCVTCESVFWKEISQAEAWGYLEQLQVIARGLGQGDDIGAAWEAATGFMYAYQSAVLQAQSWAGEAKTQQATVHQVSTLLGGIPDWGPIAETLEAKLAELTRFQAAFCLIAENLEAIEQPPVQVTLAIKHLERALNGPTTENNRAESAEK